MIKTVGNLKSALATLADDLPILVVVDAFDTEIKALETGTDGDDNPVLWLITEDVEEGSLA